MSHELIDAQINPLAFIEVDEPWVDHTNPVTPERVLDFLCTPGVGNSLEDLLERYKKISVESPRIFAAPAEERLLERLIWPLRQAKGTYMLGGYLSTISICGMVAEMAAILNFDLGSFQINDVEMTEKMQQNVFGSRFERLGQERRVNILFGYGIISSGLKEDFDTIRTKRRTYLHLWSSDHSTLADDAVACFLAAVRIVVSTLGLSIDGGKLILRQEVFQYLRDHGVEPSPSVDSGGE